MVWQKIDDQFGVHRKVVRIPRKRRLEALGLWLLALNYAGRNNTDGVLEEHELEECLARPAIVDELLRVVLWHGPGHDCADCPVVPEGGVVIHDFLVYNPDAASAEAEHDAKSKGGREGNHVRWHVQRGRVVSGCEFCESDEGSDMRSEVRSLRDRFGIGPESPGPVPVPDPQKTDGGDVNTVSHLLSGGPNRPTADEVELARRAGIKDLVKVHAALSSVVNGPLSFTAVPELVEAICKRAKNPVQRVDAYVLRACENPADVVWDYERLDLGVA